MEISRNSEDHRACILDTIINTIIKFLLKPLVVFRQRHLTSYLHILHRHHMGDKVGHTVHHAHYQYQLDALLRQMFQ